MLKWFHRVCMARCRGGSLPGRLRFAARRGVTLVELLVSTLILSIVCIAWLQIIGIQSARKEARRREAVERLSGMMDAFMYVNKSAQLSKSIKNGNGESYRIVKETNSLSFDNDNSKGTAIHPLYDEGGSPIGYQLCLVTKNDLLSTTEGKSWDLSVRGSHPVWLVGRLYAHYGTVQEAGKPFFTLPVWFGF